MVAEYLKFIKIKPAHKKIFDDFSDKFGPFSDFNFTSLYCWDTDTTASFSILNENLVIKIPDYLTSDSVVSVLGTTKIDETLSVLLQDYGQLTLVPEVTVRSIDETGKFTVTEDPDNHDYVYTIDDLVSLQGGSYKELRNKISKFNRDYASAEKLSVVSTSVIQEKEYSDVNNLFVSWAAEKGLNQSEFKLEEIAIHNFLQNSNLFNIVVVELRENDKMLGFSVNEILTNGYAICHFEKLLKLHPNISSYFVVEVAKELQKFGVKIVNWEQDLGIPGLRQAKRSYNPAQMLKKYIVTAP